MLETALGVQIGQPVQRALLHFLRQGAVLAKKIPRSDGVDIYALKSVPPISGVQPLLVVMYANHQEVISVAATFRQEPQAIQLVGQMYKQCDISLDAPTSPVISRESLGTIPTITFTIGLVARYDTSDVTSQ